MYILPHSYDRIVLQCEMFSCAFCALLTILCTSCCHYTADISVGGDSVQTGRVVSGTANHTANISINAKADQIGQEGRETFEIPLSITSDELAVLVFVEGPAIIAVNDKSGEKLTQR